ncbi:MAG: helix-turn-helix domain-containing protein [Opitutales bacterium]|nr:helix-turn-helix domain-containing protein [Opitutales bacterium]
MKGFIIFNRFVGLAHAAVIETAFLERWRALSDLPVRCAFFVPPQTFLDPEVRGLAVPIANLEKLREVEAIPCPVVNYSHRLQPVPFAINIRYDNDEIGRFAADHLCERGFHEFAFVADPSSAFSRERAEGFRSALASRGQSLNHEFAFAYGVGANPDKAMADGHAQVRAWLDQTGPSVGYFCANDGLAFTLSQALEAINPAGAAQHGIVGVDDLAGVEGRASKYSMITSVRPAFEGVGTQTAECLWRAVAEGGFRPGSVEKVPGAHLCEHASTGGFACADPLVALLARRAAAEVDAGRAPSIKDLMNRLHVPRRTLSDRFLKARGESLQEFTLGLRLRRAEKFLRETGLTVSEIAQNCGFNKHADLSERFRARFDCSPSEYRKKHQR